MSSIEEKLKTFQELIAHTEQVIKNFEDGMNSVEGQFQEIKKSGNWNDPHMLNFESSMLNPYKMSIYSMNR